MIEVITMLKKDVLDAGRAPLQDMEGLHYTSSDFDVCYVIEHLSGDHDITGPYGISTGSSYGLLRVALSDYSANFPAIVNPNLKESRITGLNKPRRSILITLRSGM